MSIKYFGLLDFYKRGKVRRNLQSLIFTCTQRVKSESMYQLFINGKKLFFTFIWLNNSLVLNF